MVPIEFREQIGEGNYVVEHQTVDGGGQKAVGTVVSRIPGIP